MGSDGTVPEGQVSKALLEDDADAAFGVRLDNDAVADAFERRVEAEVGRARRSVRPRARRRVPRPRRVRPAGGGARRARCARPTRSSAGLLDSVDPDARRGRGGGPGGVVAAAACSRSRRCARRRSQPGLLRSGTTQRTGYVQLMDMGPDRARPARRRAARLDARARGRGGRPGRQRGRPARLPRRRQRGVDVPRPHRERGAERVRGAGVAARGRRRSLALWRTALPLAARRACRGARPRSSRYLPTVYLARLFPFQDVGVAAYWAFLAVVLDRARRAVPRRRRAAVTSTR